MPKLLDDAVKKIQRKGIGKSQAFAIATSSLKKAGDIGNGNALTSKGKTRQAMGPAKRAATRKK